MAFVDGLRVLDLSDERGLLAGRILADLGADVVQVEPPSGSSARRRAPHLRAPGGSPRPDASYVWEAYAANKRGIVADPGTPEGRDLVRRLAAVADVVIETDGPAVQGPRGLDAGDLRALNPGLVYASVTAFGRTGPKAGYHAADLVLWAAGGPLDEHRDGDRPPVRISLPQAFLHAAADAAAGILLALRERDTSGAGQLVDVSAQASLGAATLGRVLADAVGDVNQDMAAGQTLGAARVDQSGSGSGTEAALKKWECRDGLVEFHIGVGPASGGFTNNFLRWMAAEGAPVERFAELDFRTVPGLIESGEFTDADTAELRSAVAKHLATKTKAEIIEAAMAYKLLCVPIFDTTDVLTSPQLAARGFFRTVGEGERARTLPGPFARTDADGCTLTRPAPALGEHTREVLDEWLSAPQRPAPRAVAGTRRLPLEGLKVLDFSWVVAGPVVGRALADFGATVVRVESSTRIETARLMPPFHGGVFGPENSALYGTWNAGKLGVTLDLRSDSGRAVARDLARWADVVIESFSPGLMRRWALDHETLRAEQPGLIMVSTSINGQTGPWSSLAGYGNIGASLSGYQSIVGWPDRPPFGPYGPYTDYVGPRFSLVALLAALRRRDATGEGCYLDVSQVEAGVWFQAPEIADNADNGTVVARMGNADREHAPHGVFPALPDEHAYQGRRYVAIAVTTDAQWRALAAAIGRPDLVGDPELGSAAGRLARAAELEEAVAEWTSTRYAADVEAALQAAGVPAHVSASSADFCSDPQLAHRGHLVRLPHPLHGETTVEGPRYLLSETPGVVRCAAPTFGQDNEKVLGELLGYDDERIKALVEQGVMR
ncbi:CaiB/BaiF CoA-transferase family protein [Amycolatopsis thermophila]|uniref:Crotonobetainyl-CoA:carnitine CoA-transferase CaiB-like acyl-CoA transferase n=1 Tax=Amycolatopsis thermophila TaxID=206084 RepID=A0ABU0F5A4_9PSEU|nr:CoA transferase [Amycolatopsis thermophila]MDQ0382773.1 crotonobetainyl-CoA:carnitine CoA-transferase CaiB-like acyl-CoA transferase [Amycolatopsis thermophila]